MPAQLPVCCPKKETETETEMQTQTEMKTETETKKVIKSSDKRRRHHGADVWLSYFKQGDDMHKCIEKDANGKINVKASLKNHMELLQSVAEHLKEINDNIPEVNDLTISGDTHCISISGDPDVIEKLINLKLVNERQFVESETENESNDDLDDELSDDLDEEPENKSENTADKNSETVTL